MRPGEIESWALSVVNRVLAGQPTEDVRVELKSRWPDDAHKVARRIAGHANAAHGEPILWLIGVDEKNQVVIGADCCEVADWWSQVKSFFNELPPELVHLNLPYDDRTVAALLFSTERRPFMVKVPGGGAIDLEVPWRDGTMVRSAKRRELITILAATCKNPSVEVLRGSLHISQNLGGRYSGTHALKLDVYVVPGSDERVVIPFHRCEGTLRFPYGEKPFALGSVSFTKTGALPADMITCSPGQVILNGPGPVTIQAVPPDLGTVGSIARSPTAHVELKLRPTGSEIPIVVTADLAEGAAHSDTTRWFSMRPIA